MTCDLHIHSQYSFDSKSALDDICATAIANKVDILAITDHCDMTPGAEGIQCYLRCERERAMAFVTAQRKHAQLELLYGIEIGNAVDMPQKTKAFLEERTFDFVLGAIHFLSDGTDIYQISIQSQADVERMFADYFSQMMNLVELGGFDSLAHIDYPIRILKGKMDWYTSQSYTQQIECILKALVEKNIALEVNTRGAYDWQTHISPEPWVLQRYVALGGTLVTIGSDAHSSAFVGAGFAQARDLLKSVGLEAYTIYRNRVPHQIPL